MNGERDMPINKTQLVSSIASEANITKAAAEKALEATINAVKHELQEGGKVTLIGFGTFKVSKRSSREGRNPKTKEKMLIPEKNVPKFVPGKELKDLVNMDETKPKKKEKK